MHAAERFWNQLKERGQYDTPEDAPRPVLDRCLGWSDTWFYIRLFFVVFVGYVLARSGRFDKRSWARRAYWVMRTAEGCGARVHIRGVAQICALQEPAVYVANHMSLLETMVAPGAIVLPYQDVTTVVKDSLMRYPVFGKILDVIDPIVVKRRNPRDDLKVVLQRGVEKIRDDGLSVMMFPQATRSAVFNPARFNSLGVKLASRAGVRVVPVAVKTDFIGIGKRFRDLGRLDRSQDVWFAFGAPIEVASGNGREAQAAALSFIMSRLREWGVEISGSKP